MDMMEYIKPELAVLAIVLYIVGIALKKSSLADKWIPWILGGAGVALAVVWVCATSPLGTAQEVLMAVFAAVTQGILCAGASVYVNQLIKQSGKEE